MHYDQYEITRGETAMTYEFVSQGPRGDFKKLVVYSRMDLLGMFNLGFGDKIDLTGDFDDQAVTDNGDALKVMATVASTLYPFTDRFPGARVYLKGSTKSRTRLYRMAISANLDVINRDFQIYGLRDEHWEKFTSGVDYESFIVLRRE